MIWNARNWTEQASSEDGSLSIEAPSMNFNNVTLSAGQTSPATISLKSAGAITLIADSSIRDGLLDKGAAYTNQMGAITVASTLATGTTAASGAQKAVLSPGALNELKTGLAASSSMPLTSSQVSKIDELFNGIALQSAAVTENSAQITLSSAQGLVVGMGLVGAGIPDGATVTAINGDTITMSVAATVASGTGIKGLWTSTQFADKRNALLTELNDALVASVRAQGIQVPLPLGFSGPEALAIQAFNVSIVSKGKPISINGVPIYANNISVSSGSVPLVATETDARVFTPIPTVNSTIFANKLYVPIAKYDSNQNGVIDADELDDAEVLLLNKSVSGANVPAGTTIQGVSRAVSVPSNAAEADAQSLSNMLELVLSGTVSFSGEAKSGSLGSDAGNFKTGTITIGETSADFPEGTIAISNVRTEGVNRGGTSAVDLKIKIEATGDLELRNNEFELMTHVDLRAKQAALLENNLFASDAELNVWAHEDVTFSGVSVNTASTAGGALNPKVSVESNSKSVYVNTSKVAVDALKSGGNMHVGPVNVATRTVMKATAVRFTADNGDIVINGVDFQGGFSTSVGNASEFSARAKNTIGVYDTTIDHSKALIAANTVVLKDVTFSDGSAVDLRSGRGLVAGNPGSGAAVLPGHVNFVSNVKYGAYGIDGLAAHGMANPGGDAVFRSAMTQRHANTTPEVTPDFAKLTIRDLSGSTK
jgi:hypothetical protein